MCRTDPRIEAPGVDYVVEKCRYVVAKNKIYFVDHYGDQREGTTTEPHNGLRCVVLSAASAGKLIRS